MRRDIMRVLRAGELIVADGSMGAMLDRAGLPAGTAPEAWNLDRPEAVAAVHRAYRHAGARLLLTNTIGGNRVRLGEAGLAEHAVEINRAAAGLARDVAGDDLWVAGSVGPTGRLMEPYGPLTAAEAEEAFIEQITALAEGGIDVVLIETHYDADEVGAALRAARRVRADLPVFCTYAFDPRGRTMMGLRAADAARRAEVEGADAVGANCGEGPAAVRVALEAMAGATVLPRVAQANAGLPRAGDAVGADAGGAVWDVTPEDMAAHAVEYYALGARVIGGCCGAMPEHIAAMAAALAHVAAA
jgi:5-methyltetrahydrofolate--homocysteine methyltransferase